MSASAIDIQTPPAGTFHTQFRNASHHAHTATSLHRITHRTHTPKHSSTSRPIQLAQMHANVASPRHKHAPHLKHPQLPTAHNARSYKSSGHHNNPRAQPIHRNRRGPLHSRGVSKLRSTQGVTTTSQPRPPHIALPPPPLPTKHPPTCPFEFRPQHHKLPGDPAIAHV